MALALAQTGDLIRLDIPGRLAAALQANEGCDLRALSGKAPTAEPVID